MEQRAISRAVWAVSVPLIFAEISETILHVTDTAFLARVGVVELGAIAIADTIYELAAVPAVAVVDGIQILTARRIGQKRHAAVGETFNQGLLLVAMASVVITVALVLTAPFLAHLLVSSPDVAEASTAFLQVIALGTIFQSTSLAYSALLVALSRTRVLIPATILLAVTNIVLDYGLVLGNLGLPRMGIAGAAWGSVGAEVITCAYLTWHVLRRCDAVKYGLFRFGRFNGWALRSLVSLSYPVSFGALVEGLRWFLFFILAERLGAAMLAASNVVYSFFALLSIPAQGFSETACSMTSHLIGRGQQRRIGPLMWQIIRPSYMVTLPFAALVLLFPETLLSLFVVDPVVAAACAVSLRVVAAAMLIVIPAEMWFAAVSGTGDTGAALAIELALTVTMLLSAYIAGVALGLPIEYVWVSLPLGWLLCLSLSYAWIRGGKWRRLAL